jgi:hypothetical protein
MSTTKPVEPMQPTEVTSDMMTYRKHGGPRAGSPLTPSEQTMLRTIIHEYPRGLYHDGARALADHIGGVSHQTLWNAVAGKPLSPRSRGRIMAHWEVLVAQYVPKTDVPYEDLPLEDQLRRQGVPEERIKIVMHYINRAFMAAIGMVP